MSEISVRNISKIDLNLLLTFHCLMAERSATRASAALNVTQGAVSAALKRLRGHFEDELFTRTASGMVPTRKALSLAPVISHILSTVSTLLTEDHLYKPHGSTRTFNIALSDDLEAFLAPLIVRYSANQNLDINFAFHQTNSTLWKVSLADVDVDLTICCEPKNFTTNYSSQILFSSSYACICRPGLVTGTTMEKDEYFNGAHVRVSYDCRRGFIDDVFEKAGYARKVLASFSHFAGALTTLYGTDAIATLPSYAAKIYAEMIGLEIFAVPLPVPSYRCFMLWDGARHNDAANIWLRGFLNDVIISQESLLTACRRT